MEASTLSHIKQGGFSLNAKKRKELDDAISLLDKARSIIESVKDDEAYCLDNTPENLQGSQRYADMEDVVEYLCDAIEDIDNAVELVDDAKR